MPPMRTISNTFGKDNFLKRQVTFHDEIFLVEGQVVIIHRKIDTGNNSRCVFLAQDARGPTKKSKLYALKRIDCRDDKDELERCRNEVRIHRALTELRNDNLMPLLGSKFETFVSSSGTEDFTCYMLFPYVPQSLRQDIDNRHLLEDILECRRRPYSEQKLLIIFRGIVGGVLAMHNAGWSHRDLKPENVLLRRKQGKYHKGDVSSIPILADFGSAGPLKVSTESWPDIIHATEEAERSTTIAYRAPELFGGGLSYGPTEYLHYAASDVWSLGCLLFAMMYGASPFEIEWRVSLVEDAAAEGTTRVVECTREKVLTANIPFPPLGGAADRRYSEDIKNLVRAMIRKASRERLSCREVADRVDKLLARANS